MTRKRRLMSLLLGVLLLCTLLPPRALAAPTLYFTAVNDRMCDLSDDTMPFWQYGILYVAGATMDAPDDLGIRYSYNQEKSVAILYKGQRVLYCDLTIGSMENNRTGERYAGTPILRNGMVFFPISALTKMFDLKYSSTRITYGYLLRIRNDNAVLSDEAFLDAATDPIQRRYAQYERAHTAASATQETPIQSETPAHRDDLTVYLLLPAADETALTQMLSTLESNRSHATLLLTPEQLADMGDGVRRAAGTGNAVALRVSAETSAEALAQIEQGNDALWRAASLRTRLVYLENADRALRAAVADAGYCPITVNASDFTRSGSHWADTALKWGGRSASVRLYLGAESAIPSSLTAALSRLRSESCTISALNEVTA